MIVASGKRYVRVDAAKSWPGAGGSPRTVGRGNTLELVGLDILASYAAIYASQPYVYSLVNKLARGIGRLPIRTWEWIDEDANEKRPTSTSELARLLKRPFPRGSRRKLVEAVIGSVCVYGKGYWYKSRPGKLRAPDELWPLDPRFTTFQVGPDVPVAHYVYRIGGIEKKILPEDVVEFSYYAPNGERGVSPLEPLRRTLALEDAATRYSIASFANGVRPSGALVAPKLEPKQRQNLEAEIAQLHSGPDNAFRMLLLEGGLDWKSFSQTASDAQTVEQRKLGHAEACAVYDIPPPAVQILDRATFSNVTEQNKALYRESFGPYYGLVESEADAQLISEEPMFDGSMIEFDLREVLRADLGERADAYVKLLSIYTPNELRGQEGLTPIDHPAADAILVPLNSTPIGPGFDLPEPPSTEARQLAAMIAGAIERSDDRALREALDRAEQLQLPEHV